MTSFQLPRGLRIDRSKAIQLLDYATRKDWIVGFPNDRWDRHDEPIRPTTLLEFIKRKGGIKEYDGELQNIELSKVRVKEFGALVNNKKGMTLDDAPQGGLLMLDISMIQAN